MPSSPDHPLIGAGAFFEVRQLREDGRDLVIKRLLSRVRREPAARAALAREAQVLAAVRHRALPSLVRVGNDEHGPCLVETLVPGASIRQIVESWSARGGVPGRLAAHITRQAFAALAELAELEGESGPLGFVHGDIGPDHVLVGPEGDARFIDLGAARVRALAPGLLGDDRGTLPFVAPEIARGEAPPSAAGDVYSMAATALFLATGEPLCAAKTSAAMLLEVGSRGLHAERWHALTAFRPAERAALAAALALEPARRVAGAREIVNAFDGA